MPNWHFGDYGLDPRVPCYMKNTQKELASKILKASNAIASASRKGSASYINITASNLIEADLVYIGENRVDLTKNSIYLCNVDFGDLYNVKNNDGIFILEHKSNFISLREFNLDKLIDNQ